MKKIIISLVAVFILILVLAVWVVFKFVGKTDSANSPSPYSAVYLDTGDIYFGKLSVFPKLKLSEVWVLQRNTSNPDVPEFGIVSLKQAFWGPVDTVYLNPNQVVFTAKLSNSSQVAAFMASPGDFTAKTGESIENLGIPSGQ